MDGGSTKVAVGLVDSSRDIPCAGARSDGLKLLRQIGFERLILCDRASNSARHRRCSRNRNLRAGST